MVVVGDAASRVVDTCLACICFSFLAASNASDVLKTSDSSWRVEWLLIYQFGGHVRKGWGIKVEAGESMWTYSADVASEAMCPQ